MNKKKNKLAKDYKDYTPLELYILEMQGDEQAHEYMLRPSYKYQLKASSPAEIITRKSKAKRKNKPKIKEVEIFGVKEKNNENKETTDTKLISMYQEVLEALNKIRKEKTRLEDVKKELKVDLALTKGETSDLEDQLSKINKHIIVDKNNKYIKKIQDLNEVEEGYSSQVKDIMEREIVTNPVFGYTVERFNNNITDIYRYFKEDYDRHGHKRDRREGILSVILTVVLAIISTNIIITFSLPFWLTILSSISAVVFVDAFIAAGLVELLTFKPIYFKRKLTTSQAINELMKKIDKVNKKKDKYKNKLEKKYGVSYEEIDNNSIELNKEQILDNLQEHEKDIDTLNDRINGIDERLKNVHEEEVRFIRLKEDLESKIGDNAILGLSEEKEKTLSDEDIEEKPKQYKKIKNKGDGNNGK